MLRQVSLGLGNRLARRLQYDDDQVQVLAYGAQIILETLITITVVVILALLLHILEQTLICLLVYAAFRTFGGGVHMSTYPRCLTVGSAIIIGLSVLSGIGLTSYWWWGVLTGTILLALACIVFWVPAGTEKKTITDPDLRNLQKARTTLVFSIWLIIIYYFEVTGLHLLAQATVYGAIGALFLITPPGYRIITFLDHALGLVRKGGEHSC